MKTVTIKLAEENNDFLSDYKDYLNENPIPNHIGRYTKESVLNWIISEVRIKFEKKQRSEAENG